MLRDSEYDGSTLSLLQYMDRKFEALEFAYEHDEDDLCNFIYQTLRFIKTLKKLEKHRK